MRRTHTTAAAGEAQVPADDGRCFAAGCPLPGGITDSTKGGGPWFCRFHHGRQSAQWPEITQEIRSMRQTGELDARPAPSPLVAEFRARLKVQA